MSESKVFSVRLPVEMLERLDGARGDVSRNAFIQGAIEAALHKRSVADLLVGSSMKIYDTPGFEARVKAIYESAEIGGAPVEAKPAPKAPEKPEAAVRASDGVSPRSAVLLEFLRKRGKPATRREVRSGLAWGDRDLLPAVLELRTAGLVKAGADLLEAV